MKKNSQKRGFTIVELVIVIAVIAILAAVLIPTFSGIVSKAKESKLIQEAKNAYTEYIAEHAEDFTNQGNMLYYTEEGTIIALKQGSPLNEVFTSAEDAIRALMGDAYDYTVKDTQHSKIFAVVPAETEESVPDSEPSQPSEIPDEPEEEGCTNHPIQCGNRFTGTSNKNQVSTKQKIYLRARTILIIKENDKYDWALYKENKGNSTTATEEYYFSLEDNVGYFRIVESGYYGFTVKSVDNTEFDTSRPESNDLCDFFEMTEKVGMYYGNKFINDTTDKTCLSSAINIYLPAGAEITFTGGTEICEWKVYKTETTTDKSGDEVASNFYGTITISEAGYYGFVIEGNDVLGESVFLFNLFEIPAYAVG